MLGGLGTWDMGHAVRDAHVVQALGRESKISRQGTDLAKGHGLSSP
jgi:hypothetical protein